MLVETNNKVTQAYINHLGGRFPFLSSIARDLCLVTMMCYKAQILLVAVHRPGNVNVRADRLSRQKQDHTDIRLNLTVFNMIGWISSQLRTTGSSTVLSHGGRTRR